MLFDLCLGIAYGLAPFGLRSLRSLSSSPALYSDLGVIIRKVKNNDFQGNQNRHHR